MPTAAVRRYWARLVEDGCLICGMPAEIAHCHGGSIVERMKEPKARGKKLDRYHWLVLPVCPFHHRLGRVGIGLDLDVGAWERRYGTQASHIDRLCERFSLDLWGLSQEGRK